MTSGDLLAQAVGELYQADPEEFTQRRGELAARARSAGQIPVARQIAALRRPTRSAWVINQLVRADPGAITRLASLGDQLRAAERSRDGGAMRELTQARRQLIATLVRQALAVSGQDTPPAAMREDITVTFAAALADPEVAGQIQQGTLIRPARRPGFGTPEAPALALVPPPPAQRPAAERERPASPPPSPEKTRQARADPGQARAETEAALAAAEQALAEADRAAGAARQAELEQESAVRRLQDQLADLRDLLHQARISSRRARSEQRRARQAVDRLRSSGG